MMVLALTGSIGMGKSTATRALRRLGVPVHDADAAVHWLLRADRQAIAAVERAFPGVKRGDRIDRAELGRRVFGDAAALRRLESILHPPVRALTARFIRQARRRRDAVVVLDIPLLLETGGDADCDGIIVLSAPDFIQCGRVLSRPGMTSGRFAAVLARQVPDAIKQRRADYVVPSGLDRRTSLLALERIVRLARRGPLRPVGRLRRRRNHA